MYSKHLLSFLTANLSSYHQIWKVSKNYKSNLNVWFTSSNYIFWKLFTDWLVKKTEASLNISKFEIIDQENSFWTTNTEFQNM